MDRGSEYIFPDINEANKDGLLAIGGDLAPSTLLEAYSHGIFPWFDNESPIMWWSPDPRMILPTDKIHISKSLSRVIKSNKYSVSFDKVFNEVINLCAQVPREDGYGTWITDQMMKAYMRLFKLGYAHSVEIWHDKSLAGGLYGVQLGRMFFGESMFHIMPDASKMALYYLTEKLKTLNIPVIDCQQETEHLKRMGAVAVSRMEFKKMIAIAMEKPICDLKWH